MAKYKSSRLTVYIGAGSSAEDRNLRMKLRMRFAAEGIRVQGWSVIKQPIGNQNPMDNVRSNIAASDCVVLLTTPSYAASRRPSSEIGIAFAFEKPIYLLLKDVNEDSLPTQLHGFPTFAWRNLDQLIERVRQHELELTKPESEWLQKWYKSNRLPLEKVLNKDIVLDDLKTGFEKASKRTVAPQKLLGELFRMRKQGKLPNPLRKSSLW